MGDEVQWVSRVIAAPASIDVVTLLGPRDAFLRVLEDRPAADIHARGSQVTVTGKPGDMASAIEILTELIIIIHTDQGLSEETVERVINLAAEDLKPSEILAADIIFAHGRIVRPKTLSQKRYMDAIDRRMVVFGTDPAGIGKAYLVMAKAVQVLQSKQVNRIILTCPAIEAREWLGFLLDTLNDKIDPYLRPLYDALHDMVEADLVSKLLTSGTIEVAPLVYIRGRTLNDAFIILDEAQNTSSKQAKMFLIRFGFDSKVAVTGDITQIDLPGGVCSRSRQVTQILDGVEDIAFRTLTVRDVVCRRLVGGTVVAYDSYDSIQQGEGGK